MYIIRLTVRTGAGGVCMRMARPLELCAPQAHPCCLHSIYRMYNQSINQSIQRTIQGWNQMSDNETTNLFCKRWSFSSVPRRIRSCSFSLHTFLEKNKVLCAKEKHIISTLHKTKSKEKLVSLNINWSLFQQPSLTTEKCRHRWDCGCHLPRVNARTGCSGRGASRARYCVNVNTPWFLQTRLNFAKCTSLMEYFVKRLEGFLLLNKLNLHWNIFLHNYKRGA